MTAEQMIGHVADWADYKLSSDKLREIAAVLGNELIYADNDHQLLVLETLHLWRESRVTDTQLLDVVDRYISY